MRSRYDVDIPAYQKWNLYVNRFKSCSLNRQTHKHTDMTENITYPHTRMAYIKYLHTFPGVFFSTIKHATTGLLLFFKTVNVFHSFRFLSHCITTVILGFRTKNHRYVLENKPRGYWEVIILHTRQHSSRMRTARMRPSPHAHRDPGQRPPEQRSLDRDPLNRDPWTESPLEGTLAQGQRPLEGARDQAARQQMTSYRDPLLERLTDASENITLPQTSFAGGNNYICVRKWLNSASVSNRARVPKHSHQSFPADHHKVVW